MFPKSSDSIREAVPTADEGDALLDMLFDDAPRDSSPVEGQEQAAAPAGAPAAPTIKSTPPPPPVPEPPPTHKGEVVAPPGWPRPARPAPRPSAETLPNPDAVEHAAALDTLDDDDDDLSGATIVAQSAMAVAPREPFGAQTASRDSDVQTVHEADLQVAESIAPDAVEEEPGELAPAAEDAPEDEVVATAAPTLSERPVAPPRAPLPTLGFSDELDAAALLAGRGATSKVVARAQMLLAEAQLQTDKSARARLVLVASELYAQAGEDDLAASAAKEAHVLAPNLAMPLRQHRAMLVRSGDWGQASEALEAELRHMPTPEARAHAAWLLAEVSRVVHQDEAAAKKRIEQASRAHPNDPRPAVSRFIEAVAANDAAAIGKIRVPDPEAHAELAAGFALSSSLRGAPTKGGATRTPRHVAEAVMWARDALGTGDPSAVEQVIQLRQASFAAPASWVGAAFAAAKSETRASAVSLLRTAAEGSASLQATRALARLAVETSQPVDGRDATIFGPTDRVTLAAFDAAGSGPAARASRETLAGVVDDAGANPGGEGETVAELSSAVIAALAGSPSQRLSRLRFAHAGEPTGRAAALLGRSLGTAGVGTSPDGAAPGMTQTVRESIDAALTEVASAGSESGEPSAYVRALMLELDIDAGSAERVAQTVATWGSADAPDATATLAAAILAELAGDASGALKIYADLHQESPTVEAIARILAAEPGQAPLGTAALRDFAERVSDPQHKAALFTECAIRLQGEAAATAEGEGGDKEATTWTEAAESAAKTAAETAPEIPIATHLGELGARSRADQESLLDWLRFRRETSDDLVERAYDLVREALLVSDGESSTAATLLEEALRARPDDYCLRDLYERLSPEPPGDRGAWRESRALELQGAGDAARPEASRLAVEAALEYERTGDLDAAARCARLAETLGESELSPIAAYRFALAGHGTAELVDALLPQARNATEPDLRIEIYERLAELDERGREDTASGLLFRRTILEENPTHVRTLRRVASALMAGGREEELESIAMELARTLEGGEAAAYAALAARLRWRTAWEQTAEPVAIAYAQQPRPLWAIRQMCAHARHRGDHAVVATCERELLTLTDRPAEQATLALRAAESLTALGETSAARDLLSAAVEACPQHVVARLSLAATLESLEAWELAANELTAAAREIESAEWRTELDFRAAVLLQDKVGDAERAREALERVSAADPGYADVFDRLRTIYTSAGARGELAELLSRRLQAIEDPNERVEMEVMRGKALAEVGDSQEAKRALAAALDANPDHVEALSSFADLCHEEGDYEGSEQALIRLARLTSDPDRQIEIYLRLGALYDDPLDNADRAEAAYQEILKRRPADEGARLRLINLYRRTGNPTRALEEQNVLVNAAENPEDKCARTVELAEILEETGELKKAENTLVVARKSFPKSDLALRALVQFYQRTGQAPAAAVLLDRAVADARRALATGRFETFLFETLASAAELRGRSGAAEVANATVHAIEGRDSDLAGVDARAANASLDDLLAPEVMTPAFRELLLRTGPMLDTAFPYDLDAVRATALPSDSELGDEIQELAQAYELGQLQVLSSPVLGPICVPARSFPPTLVLGATLVDQPRSAERTFLLHRAMKVLQSNAAVFARTAPIDLWPLLAAYLRTFNREFSPQGVDATRFAEAQQRLARAVPDGLPADTSILAGDVVGTIGNRASTLNSAINGWGSRAGLLATGNPSVALTAIAWAGGNANGPPPSGKDRLTWIGRNAEARDLMIFSVADAYADARSRTAG
jgi:tetratricopeptide (TPR) repeat protein